MLLEVRPDNASAIALYRRLGFSPVTTRRDYYGPGQDALVMLRTLATNDAWAVECAWEHPERSSSPPLRSARTTAAGGPA